MTFVACHKSRRYATKDETGPASEYRMSIAYPKRTSTTVKIALNVTPSMKMNRNTLWSIVNLRVSKMDKRIRPIPPRVAPPIAQYERTFSDFLWAGSNRWLCPNSRSAARVKTKNMAVMTAPTTNRGFRKLAPTSEMSIIHGQTNSSVWPLLDVHAI